MFRREPAAIIGAATGVATAFVVMLGAILHFPPPLTASVVAFEVSVGAFVTRLFVSPAADDSQPTPPTTP